MYKISFFDGFDVEFSFDEMEIIIEALSALKFHSDSCSEKIVIRDLIKKLNSLSDWEVQKK